MACIYKITNVKNNKFYIGSTHKPLKRRKSEHLSELRNNRHGNNHLQNSFNKYGIDNFIFDILEDCMIPANFTNKEKYKYLTDRELYFIKLLNPQYNICKETAAGMLGKHYTEEFKEHLRMIHIGKTHTEETKKLIKEKRAKQVITEEHKKRISEGMIGKNTWSKGSKQSKEQKEKARIKLSLHYINKTGIFDPEVQKKRIKKMKHNASKISI